MKVFAFKNKKQSNYFEGWYFKCTNSITRDTYAFIFALTRDTLNPHSFIQFVNGKTKESFYYNFPIDEFYYDKETNTVHIGDNYLNENELYFKNDILTFQASSNSHKRLNKYQFTNSAMGLLSIAPLECFQEIIYMEADVSFSITSNNVTTKNDGLSYMEKTYGTNFPEKWVWFQSNYSDNNSAISFSVGVVPFLFFKPQGFLFVLKYNGLEERFGSFNLSRIKVVKQDEKTYKINIKKYSTCVELIVNTSSPLELVGPRKNGIMDLKVFECINASGSIRLFKNEHLIFEDNYHNAGLELMY